MTLRSVSLKRNNSDINRTSNGSKKVINEESTRIKNWEVKDIKYEINAMCASPRPRCELDAAAVKLQKVYKSYRTRRNLADCAVVVEELWWKALDFASLKHSSVSFFNVEKPETAISRWSRARTRAAKVGKGLSKSDNAQKLALQHWLEAIDPRHRYGHNLHFYYDVWFKSESTQPFFYWLDIGDGKEVNIEKCPRNTLQNQCIRYLGPNEREAYEVIVENGKLVYKQSGVLVDTAEGSKWIFVLSTLRALYVGKKKKGKFQHSSFLAGGAITAAGRLVVKAGILKVIWPYSGHYMPTEENFREFIKYLKDHGVNLTDVKRSAIDRDECLSFKKLNYGPIKTEGEETDTTEVHSAQNEETRQCETEEEKLPKESVDDSDTEEEELPKEPTRAQSYSKLNSSRELSIELGERLSCNWTTGAGPRIGCVRDYPSNLQCKALEQVNLSPRFTPSSKGNKSPIPSPRPSPGLRLSPRLAYMGIPSPPTISLTLPKSKKWLNLESFYTVNRHEPLEFRTNKGDLGSILT